MPAPQPRRATITTFACIATIALAGCGGSSAPSASTPASPTARAQPAHATPAQSNADVGGRQVQSASGQRVSRRAHRGQAKITRGKSVQRANLSPNTSKDDSTSVVIKRVNPCSLVSVSEAEAITGAAFVKRVEAPLGPTCIYRRGRSKADITLALEAASLTSVTHGMVKPTKVAIKGRTAVCGKLGTQMLFVPLPDGSVLNVTAPCAVAQRFASTALNRLTA